MNAPAPTTAMLTDLARRPVAAAEMLREQLTSVVLNAHPHHDNSIAWLLWHAAREIDVQLAALTALEPVWSAAGFDVRFALGTVPDDLGYGHTPEQARAIVVDDPGLLLEHLAAVVDAQVAFIETLAEADLSRVVDERWDPPVTLGVRLVSISADALEHVAQAAYVLGIGERGFEGS